MIKIKNVTIRNFMSIGNATQAINLDRNDLTLIIGDNLDLGGNGSKNGVGKCLGINTTVKLRNKITGEIYEITVGDLFDSAKNKKSNL